MNGLAGPWPFWIKLKENMKDTTALWFQVGVCLHITKETSVLVMTARELGVRWLFVQQTHFPDKMQLCSFLFSKGISVFARRGETKQEYNACIRSCNLDPDQI